MTEKKNWGSTVLGWFVVQGDQAGGTTPPAEGESPEEPDQPDQPRPVVFETGVPPSPGGVPDFDAVFSSAGIGSEERELFAKASSLLTSLPEGTEPSTRKTIVEASLKAFGVPIDRIIETGALSIQTLEAYLREQSSRTKGVAEDSEKLIADYEAKIRDVRALLERRIGEQGSVQAACNGRKLEIQKVLEFFGQEAVARVVRTSPKLIEPVAAATERKDGHV
jgi:hypothetical protein